MGFHESVYPFGGVGMMVDEPTTIVQISSSDKYDVYGVMADRINRTVASWAAFHRRPIPSNCVVQVIRATPPHIGLGSGTQLALCVARALNVHYGLDSNGIESVVRSVERGRRSSVGSWGFHLGGCIVELGASADQTFAPLRQRIAVPEEWRVLVAWAPQNTGLHGKAEESAFSRLPQISPQTTEALARIALNRIIPALEHRDFSRFSQSIYEYGMMSGRCFEVLQGGPFASEQIAGLVDRLNKFGICGVGQSSWGPAVYAILKDDEQANWLQQKLEADSEFGDLCMLVTTPNNCGATTTIPDHATFL